MKFLSFLTVFLVLLCQGASAREWFEGVWMYDESLTERHNPGITSSGLQSTREGFDKWAGQVGVTPRRIKGKKAKLGVPYRVVGRDGQSVVFEVKGAVVEIVKAFRPDLRKLKLQCRVTRINQHVLAFEVPELRTITMFMRRVQ